MTLARMRAGESNARGARLGVHCWTPTWRRGICTAAASTDSAAKAGPLDASRASSRASLSPAAVRLALRGESRQPGVSRAQQNPGPSSVRNPAHLCVALQRGQHGGHRDTPPCVWAGTGDRHHG